MTRLIGFNRLVVTGLVAVAAALSLTQVANAGLPGPDVPPEIRVDDQANEVFLIDHAVGVQIYTCNGSTWSSAMPRANLYDDNGKLIIAHFRGPTWQAKGRQPSLRHGREQGQPRSYRHRLGTPVHNDDSGTRR